MKINVHYVPCMLCKAFWITSYKHYGGIIFISAVKLAWQIFVNGFIRMVLLIVS